jgi:hypothetical protein
VQLLEALLRGDEQTVMQSARSRGELAQFRARITHRVHFDAMSASLARAPLMSRASA